MTFVKCNSDKSTWYQKHVLATRDTSKSESNDKRLPNLNVSEMLLDERTLERDAAPSLCGICT